MLTRKLIAVLAFVVSGFASSAHVHRHQHRQEKWSAYSRLARRNLPTYTVVSGDTGSSISAKYSITFSTLYSFNSNVHWTNLQIGQAIEMPSLRRPITYNVASGDTGNAIAARYNTLFADLSAANPNIDWNVLQIGQALFVPGYGTATSHVVVSGDTGIAIATSFEISFESLSAANPNVNWNNLQIGQVLQVPAGSSPGQSSTPMPTTFSSNFLSTTSPTSSASQSLATTSSSFTVTLDSPTTKTTTTNESSFSSSSSSVTSPTSRSTTLTKSSTITSTTPSTTSSSSRASTLSISYPASTPSTNPGSLNSKTSSTRFSTSRSTSVVMMKSSTTSSSSIFTFSSSRNSASTTRTAVSVSKTSKTIAPYPPASSSTSSFTSSSGNGASSVSRSLSSSSSTLSMTSSSSITPTMRNSTSKSSATTTATTSISTEASSKTTIPIATTSSSQKRSTASTTPSKVTTISLKPTTTTTNPTSSNSEPAVTNSGTVASPNAVPTITNSDGVGPLPDTYTFYSGNGSAVSGWPPISSWTSFSSMWSANAAVIGTNCVGGVNPNSASENQQIYDAIQAVAAKSELDHRMILAVVMQESNGCVRVPTTTSGGVGSHANPGLMQSYAGAGSCNNGTAVLNPCPVGEIFQMIEDGVFGTLTGDGFVQGMNYGAGGGGYVGSIAFYRAARYYNSGSVAADGDLGTGPTKCYCSDIANRLTGWVKAASTCHLDGN